MIADQRRRIHDLEDEIDRLGEAWAADRAGLQAEVVRLHAALKRETAHAAAPRRAHGRRSRPVDRYGRAVAQAAARGKPWHLYRHEYDALAERPCSYCDGPTGSGVGLDRLDNAQGYETRNVVPCCGACNLLRGNRLSPEETRAAAQAILATKRGQSARDHRAETL